MSQYETISIQLNIIQTIPQRQQLLLISNALLEKLQQRAAEEKSSIFINYEELSFVIKHFDNKSPQNLLTILKQLQIFNIPLKSKAEAHALNKLIKQNNLNKKLQQLLQCEVVNTSIYDEITQNICYNSNLRSREQFFISPSQLFLVFQNKNHLHDKQEVEQIFRNFIKENFRSCTKILKAKKEHYFQLKEKLLLIEQNQTEVLIEIEEKLNEYQISLTKWIERENQNSQEDLFTNIIQELLHQQSFEKKQIEITISAENQSSIINTCFIELHFVIYPQQYFSFILKQFNNSNYFIKANQNEHYLMCKIYIKGKNKQKLRQKALIIIQNITKTDYQITNPLLSTLSKWRRFRESLNIMLNFFIQEPICVIQYNNSKNNQLHFSIFYSENFQEIIKNLTEFITTLQVLQCNFSVDIILQLYNVENQEQLSKQEHIIIGDNYILGQESQLKKVISKILVDKSQIQNDSNLQQTIQIDNIKKYSIIKEELQKNKPNLQVKFNDFNQQMSLQYTNNTELTQFQHSIESDINFKSIIFPNKLAHQLEKTQLVQQLEYQNQVQIFSNVQNRNEFFEVTFFNENQKKFILSQGNMHKSDCQLIVNINRDFQTLLIREKINDQCYNLIDKLGNKYQTIIKTQIQNQPDQQNLNMINDKYILTLSNLNYNEEEGYENEKCFEDLERNLDLIFTIAQNSKIQSIALPIFGCGPCDKAFDIVARKIFTKIITNLKNSQSVQQVTIYESYQKRFKMFQEIIKTELDPSLKYVQTFKWGIGQKLFEKDIAEQIDQGFENYKNDTNLDKILLQYSYFKPDFTHEVDLIQNKIVNIKLKTILILEQKLKGNCFEFFINKEPIEERLNNFLNLCVCYRYKTVKINLSEIQVVFDQNNARISSSNFPVQKYFVSECKQQEKLLSDFTFSSGESQKNSTLELYQCDEDRKKNIQEQIDTYLSENSQIAEFNLSQLSNNKREAIYAEIKNMSIEVISQDQYKIVFKFLKKQQSKIESKLQQFLKFKMPKELQMISPNYEISNLEQNDEYFMKIKQQINLNAIQDLQVQKIKNAFLWDQFIVSALQIQKRNKAENVELNNNEQEQMLWVILENHPKESYDEKSQGIKSIRGYWGFGGYFTKKLSEKNLYQERTKIHLALFCKVCIGKCMTDKKQHISSNYDCFYDQIQELFFIKGKIITRAYPMYQLQIKFF